MNKRNTRRGFTITELVIVIVVIAILAAVLIPTFASLIKKANQSADIQMAKNLNTILVMDEATNGKPTTFEEALSALREGGYLLANINPTAEGCYLAWEKETNQVLLIELTNKADKYKILFSAKKDFGEPDDSWYFAVKDQAAAEAVKAALPNVNVEMTILDTTVLNTQINSDGEKTVYIDGSIVTDAKNVIKQDNANAKTTIDLGSNTVTGGSNNTADMAIPFQVSAGELNLKGGLISATAAFVDADGKTGYNAVNATGGVLNVTDTVFKHQKTETYIVSYEGGDGTMKNVTIDTPNANNVIGAYDGSELRLEDCKVTCDYIGVFASSSGGVSSVEIAGGTYYAKQTNLLTVHGGVITVEDGTFTNGNPAKLLKFYNVSGGKIVLKGGTFNGIAFANLTEDTIRGMCNLSECANGVNVVKVNGAWEITVK